MKRITVLLAEEHTIVREGFRTMLKFADDLEVGGEAENGHQTGTGLDSHTRTPRVVTAGLLCELEAG